MFGVILKATNSSFQNGMTFYCSVFVKKVMKLLAFIFEQPSYGTPIGPIVNKTSLSTTELTKSRAVQPTVNSGEHIGDVSYSAPIGPIVNITSQSATESATSTDVQPTVNSGEHIGHVYMVHL